MQNIVLFIPYKYALRVQSLGRVINHVVELIYFGGLLLKAPTLIS